MSLYGLKLECSYSYLPEQFFTRISPIAVRAPHLMIFNHMLAESLGLEVNGVSEETLAQFFSGNMLPEGVNPIAQAYAGHQFGHFAMLGDGRAHLIGELITQSGERYDIQLKGSGRTPYSRRGDGRAAIAPMLREYLISEAMYALGIPTTRSLAVVATGEPVLRNTVLSGAILARVAESHLRVGTFEYAADKEDFEGLKKLADYAISRHYPNLIKDDNPYLAFLHAVIARQAKLVASWMAMGFIHGVMNTDNMTISGETIDYGPCAFMDQFSMDRVFSSIDINGRYAYGNQPHIAQWNLMRLAEAILPLLHDEMSASMELAQEAIAGYNALFNEAWLSAMRKKLGLFGEESGDILLIQDLLQWMQDDNADYTLTFRDLIQENIIKTEKYQSSDFGEWYVRWQARLARNLEQLESSLSLMRANNPVIIPRNHCVEEALDAAEDGDISLFMSLLKAVQRPYDTSEANLCYRDPPKYPNIHYQTFCGT